MFQDFEQYLSFGATDQETMLALEGRYQGLLVPGTIAALQREGTGGFLLALSAAQAKTRYVIDPRTPLFQQTLPTIKKSFGALAKILNDEEAATVGSKPTPEDFTDARLENWARGWVKFNEQYIDTAGAKFDKYAKKLKKNVEPDDAKGPELIIAPYFVAINDDWWTVSLGLFDKVRSHASSKDVVQAVVTESVGEMDRRLGQINGESAVIWVSDFAELEKSSEELTAYGTLIRKYAEAGKKLFALYGGYFSILMCGIGLTGLSHGIGYGDSRAWVELPQSGPPAPRFYLPRAHRYVSRELAQRLFSVDAKLVECGCQVCKRRPPLTLTYHELMQHSVMCRANEMEVDARRPRDEIASDLDTYHAEFISAIDSHEVGDTPVGTRLRELTVHLPRWSSALRAL